MKLTVRNKISIDEDGDLIFIVGIENQRLRLSSKLLTIASKVFKIMLFGHFKESRELAER